MSIDHIDHPAVKALRSFFLEMHVWGSEMLRHYRSINWGNADAGELARSRAKQREDLEAIFDKYCEAGLKALRLRDQGMSFSDPPEYNPEKEVIIAISESPGKFIVETKGPEWRFKYEIIKNDSDWRIRDNKKYSSDKNPKWRSHML